MQLRRAQSGIFTIAIAVFVAALVGSFLLASFAQLVHDRKVSKVSTESRELDKLASHAMNIYAQNVLDIEQEGPARADWIANPNRFLAGAQQPVVFRTRPLGIVMSPVRSYVGQGTALDRAQYYAYSRIVLYLGADSLRAANYLPWFDTDGVLHECGAVPAGDPCPVKIALHELPTANWAATRLETAVRQVDSFANLLVTYFNTQVLLDPVHEMATNHFRDPYCASGSQIVPMGRLPCLTGFVSLYDPQGQDAALIELLMRSGVTAAGLPEYFYPWGLERASRLELANEEGLISGTTTWANSTSYPYTLTVRQPLPWPAPDGSVTYVKAIAVQP